MVDDDAWRRERAERLFPHNTRISSTELKGGDAVLPLRSFPQAASAPSPSPSPPVLKRRETATAVKRRISKAAAVCLVLPLAALSGWLIRDTQTVAAPPLRAAAPAALPLPAILAVSAAPATPSGAAPAPLPTAPARAKPRMTDTAATMLSAAEAAPDQPARPSQGPAVDRVRFANSTPLPGRRFAPSFDCRRDKAASNRMICADPVLSTLDNLIAERFRSRMAGLDLAAARALDADQTDFLNRRIACNNARCIERAYRDRLMVLQDRPGRGWAG